MDLSEILEGGAKDVGEYNDSEEYDGIDSDLDESANEEPEEQLEKLGAFVDGLMSKQNSVRPKVPAANSKNQSKQDNEPSHQLALTDILDSLTDPGLQSLRKSLAIQNKSNSKSSARKLSAPLAKPLQEKLEREAAYEETKKEISKWQPFVKSNREVYPL
jgi:U3 small nucleolar RNA-associated protein 14